MAFNIKDLSTKIKPIFGGEESASATDKGVSTRQILFPILGMLIFIGLAFYVINQVRVNGPVYDKIKANQDLRADILPPPLYAVDAFAAANEAFVATSNSDFIKRDKKLAEVSALEIDYKNRVAFWQNTEQGSEMQGTFKAVVKSNDNFYRIYNKDYLPAIKLGAIDAAKPLADLADAYEVNKQTVKAINAELEKEIIKVNTSSNNLLNTILTLLALLGLLILFLIWYFGKRQAQTINSAVMMLENDGQQNQMAVLNLLDEMGDLADGDLTVRAEVKENITGAIADSINYTIDSLRGLVNGINRASQQVSTATAAATKDQAATNASV